MVFVASQIAVWMVIAFVVGIFVGWIAKSRQTARSASERQRRFR
jgi:Na+/H+-dicarboxylate symporter